MNYVVSRNYNGKQWFLRELTPFGGGMVWTQDSGEALNMFYHQALTRSDVVNAEWKADAYVLNADTLPTRVPIPVIAPKRGLTDAQKEAAHKISLNVAAGIEHKTLLKALTTAMRQFKVSRANKGAFLRAAGAGHILGSWT